MTTEFGAMSLMLTRSAAGLNATSTSGWSPGVWMSRDANWIWKPETPGSVPAGARISAGKSGNVERSLPTTAEVVVNWPPTCWTPSPESPAKRMVTFSRTSRLRPVFGAVVSVVMRIPFSGGEEVRTLYPLRSEEHTSELQSQSNLVCRLLLEKKNKKKMKTHDV